MKKVLKIIGIIALILIIAVFILLKALSGRPAAPTDYQKTVKTGGSIEQKYMADGPYETAVYECAVLQEFEKITVHYPAELQKSDKRYPVIVICNGSGIPVSKYPAVSKHLASWGFIVIGTEENYSWNGFGAEMCLRYLEVWNENAVIEDKDSIFYQKADFDNVGAIGHSQGGVGVINAVTNTAHRDIYKAAALLSPTNKELAHNLLWDYDATLVNTPIMLISGEGGGDDWVVTGEQLKEIYDDIPSQKLMARRCGTAHGDMLYAANGYAAAWFMYHLKGDVQAGAAFFGEGAEIFKNECYCDAAVSDSVQTAPR